MSEVYGDDDFLPKDLELTKIPLVLRTERATPEIPQPVSPEADGMDPGLNVLLDPKNELPGLSLHTQRNVGQSPDEPEAAAARIAAFDTSDADVEMTERQADDAAAAGAAETVETAGPRNGDMVRLAAGGGVSNTDLATRTKVGRIDSAQDDDGSRSPNAVKSLVIPPLMSETSPAHDVNGRPGTSEALHSQSAATPRELTSPIAKSASSDCLLPSFKQLANSLTDLAEAAMKETRPPPPPIGHYHSQSFGSATSQSPVLSHHHPAYPVSIQTSPQAYYPPTFAVRSPTSTLAAESPHYAPAAAYPGFNSFAHRRTPSVQDGPGPPSLPAASSSGESHGGGYPGSSTDGYSTAHTTPLDGAQLSDGTPRPSAATAVPVLPPPNGMVTNGMVSGPSQGVWGPYVCDEPDCTAQPFQTQYLLTSHKNVHSQTRPHYCPVENCPRASTGKGFKRKNEMIRHRLVHNSPGYVCPFCADREHRYPRPDNLQRHVKVHHSDKDKDDPALRGVLDQRIEGMGKSRRRRTDGGSGGGGGL